MKELTIEEKAKAYDSIFERLKKMYNNNKTNIVHRLIYERYFPELVESEDERIRKALIQYIKDKVSVISGWRKEELITWLENLEKQKESKPVEQKATWSEDDERIRGAICDTLDRIDEYIMKCHQRLTHQQVKDWLKSLKDRMTPTNKNDFDRGYEVGASAAKFNQWKPTKEQLEALEWSLGDYRNVIFEERHDTLTSLYNDLKKL